MKSPLKRERSLSKTTEPVFDLDDPHLISKFLSQPPPMTQTITCRFLAVPFQQQPTSSDRDVSRYGTIMLESKDKLIMRLPGRNRHFLDRVRNIWVSKYLAPLTECTITFDMPKRDRDQSTTVIIQRIRPKTGVNGRANSLVSDAATEDSITTATTATMGDPSTAEHVGEGDVPRRGPHYAAYGNKSKAQRVCS